MEQQIRQSLEAFTKRARAALDAELDTLATELMRAAEAAAGRARAEQDAAVAEVQTAILARESAARAELQRQLDQRLEEARSEARAAAIAETRTAAAGEHSDAAAARASEREARLAAIERLLASVRRIDAAGSLRETLEVLVQSASLETPRVAVLLIEGSSVRPFSQRGFNGIPDSGPIAPGGIVEAAIRDGQPASTSDEAELKAPGFADLAADRAGFAAPLRVGARTVAVLYADDAGEGDHHAPAAWPEALELLARHASLHLENLTAVRVASASGVDVRTGAGLDEEGARKYARLLISEIKLYNEADVRLGREHRDLGRRLAGEIERARSAYRDRVPETLAARDRYFESELVETLAGGDASAL